MRKKLNIVENEKLDAVSAATEEVTCCTADTLLGIYWGNTWSQHRGNTVGMRGVGRALAGSLNKKRTPIGQLLGTLALNQSIGAMCSVGGHIPLHPHCLQR